MRVKRGCGGVGQLPAGDQTHGSALGFGQLENVAQRFARGVHAHVALIDHGAAGHGRRCCGFVGYRQVVCRIGEQRHVGQGALQDEAAIGAPFVEPGGGNVLGHQAVADKKDDSEGFLQDPALHIPRPEGDKEHQANERKKLVSELHRDPDSKGAEGAVAMRI